jgi:glycine cleavage system H protein
MSPNGVLPWRRSPGPTWKETGVAENPRELRYTKEHEWVHPNQDGTATVGITHFAQDQLGDIVYVSLPPTGSAVAQFGRMGEVESVKSVSDLFCPVTGQVLEVNQGAVDHPEQVNEDPYGKGWLVKVRLADPRELQKLLTAEQYEGYLATVQH